MNCKNCQAQLDEENAVCPVCGAAQEPEETAVPEVTEEAAEEVTEEVAEEAAEETAEEAVEETAAEEVEEVQPPKRKTWVKVTAIACCVVLFLGLAAGVWYSVNGGFTPRANDVYYKDNYTVSDEAAQKAADKVVATIGDKELTNGQLQIYYWMSVYDFASQYSSYLSYFGLDVTQPLSEQYVTEGGDTWEQYFLSAALGTWQNYQSLLIRGEAEGYEMSQELREQLDAMPAVLESNAVYYGFTSAEEMVKADMGTGVDMDDYMAYLNTVYNGTAYFEELYNQVAPTREEVEAHFDQNGADIEENYGVTQESGRLIDVRHILICPKGGTTAEDGTTTYSDEEWETCRLEAESLLESWRSGEATEESFAALATEATEDPGSSSTGGLYTYVYEGQMVPAFNDWCFDESRQPGDTGLVQTNYGYHVMYFVYGEEGWLRYSEQDLITKTCTEFLNQCIEDYPIEVDYKKIVLGSVDLAG